MILYHLYRRWQRRRAALVAAGADVIDAAFVGTPRAGARGPLALLLHQARFDLRASLRNPRARFFVLAFPILLLVILTAVVGSSATTTVDGVRIALDRYYVGGILALAIINAAYSSLVITVVTARESGVLKRRRATPAPAWLLIGGQALATLATTLVMSTVLLLVARIGWSIGFAPGALAAIYCAVVLGTLVFSCVGYAIASLIDSPDAAQPIAQVTLLPLFFISGIWIASASLPHALRSVAAIFPIEHLAAAMHQASVHGSFTSALSPSDLLVLAAWGVGAAVFAARRFSWLPGGSTTRRGLAGRLGSAGRGAAAAES